MERKVEAEILLQASSPSRSSSQAGRKLSPTPCYRSVHTEGGAVTAPPPSLPADRPKARGRCVPVRIEW